MKRKIVNIIGASGSGKSSLGRELIKIGIPEIISHTSRKIRHHDGEIEGVSYYFTTKEDILNMDKKGELVEHIVYSGNHYAISKEEIQNKLQQSNIVLAITDRQGNKRLKEVYGEEMVETIFIFIDVDTLSQRLRDRGESEELINERINNIKETKEMNNYEIADYVILNRDFNKAKHQLIEIINHIRTNL